MQITIYLSYFQQLIGSNDMKTSPKPLVLLILDGWGYRTEKDANAIAAAHKPNWDKLWQSAPHCLISGSGRCVGLPDGQMGNSEVGHLNMGAGRIVNQDFTRIDLAVESGEFFMQPVLIEALNQAKHSQKAVHILGLLSPGGVHSHENHLLAMMELASRYVSDVNLHAILDGRDTPPKSALASIEKVESLCNHLKIGKIASLIGRYYAMDRDQRWERVEKAYDLFVSGKAECHISEASAGLLAAYARDETDEFVAATAIHAENELPVTINDGDIVIFMNFRADRAREITRAFVDVDFKGFVRERWPQLGTYLCLTQYDKTIAAPIVYPPQSLEHIFADCISRAGMKQLRIAETEKYAHVTFFFNGGIEKPYPLEDRILIPSPKVATYDLQPEMSAPELTDRLCEAISQGGYDVIICNYANPDMVGHTGNFEATVKAIETIDTCIGHVVEALRQVGGELLITADHGNAEQMFDYATSQPHTAHTTEKVPCIYVGREAKMHIENGKLSDISPTMLYLLNLPIPDEMTGQSLVELV